MKISDSIKVIKGIGPKKYLEFSKLNIKKIEDLIYFFPKSYQDRTKIKSLSMCNDQEKTGIIVRIKDFSKDVYIKGRKLTITKVIIEDKGTIGEAIWFNMPYIKNTLKLGKNYYLYGKIKKNYNHIQIETPDYKLLKDLSFTGQGIIPIYRSTSRLKQKEIRKLIDLVLSDVIGQVEEYLPSFLRQKYNLCDINFALKNIHFPKDFYYYKIAKNRLVFDEFFLIQMALKIIKKNNSEKAKGIIFKTHPKVEKFINKLPYQLTNAQRNVINEIMKDFTSGKIMNRLVQGDVGSGKTVIAAIALLIASLNGYQGAMMAPTEILANQHYLTFNQFFEKFNLNICLLTGNINNKKKSNIIKKISEGRIDIIIGTHAIIQEDVSFYKLGLVITDEQHRFGVKQRALLNKKGDNPHVMVMTATPIPRTLSYMLYGDLDISIINELPPGRKKIETHHINSNLEKRLYEFIKKQVNQGRQIYIVCPLVEETSNIEARSVLELKEYLEKNYFNKENIAIIHGKLKKSDKDAIMRQFKEGLIDILISTTIIEVGVNVPNASIMVIQNAERFGLSQLHQLRGRVGRGPYQSYCFLISDNYNDVTKKRMKTMTSTDNGFIIAEKDLIIRGPGEFLGVRQHGLPELKIGNIINDIEIISKAKKACEEVIELKEYELIEEYIKKKFEKKLNEVSLN